MLKELNEKATTNNESSSFVYMIILFEESVTIPISFQYFRKIYKFSVNKYQNEEVSLK